MGLAAAAGIGAVATIGGSMLAGSAQKKAANTAANAEMQAAQLQVEEARAAREQARQLLSPFVNAGSPALQGMLDLAGFGGQGSAGTPGTAGTPDFAAYVRANPDLAADFNKVAGKYGNDPAAYGEYHWNRFGQFEGRALPSTGGTPGTPATAGIGAEEAQRRAIAGIEGSPIFQSLARQGEDAILQNASATGGLRGGNVQGALAQFRPALLNQQIEQNYAKLAGLAGMGQNAAAGTGAAGINAAGLTGQAFGNMGSAGAGAALAAGQANANTYGAIGAGLGNVLGNINWGGGGYRPGAGITADATNTIASNPSIF